MKKKKIVGAVAATAVGVALMAAPASAHVTVNPNTEPKGGYAKLTFRVPTEEDNASTVKLELDIPTDHPIASVSVQPQDGWSYTVQKTTLPTPITTDDGQVTQAVSQIVWTSTGTGIKPGEFNEFNISAGPLPSDTNSIEFKALQTYSNGDVVRWIENTPATGPEPDHPAPVLTLTAADTATPMTATVTTSPVKKSEVNTALTIGIIGLVVGLLGLIFGAIALVTSAKRKS